MGQRVSHHMPDRPQRRIQVMRVQLGVRITPTAMALLNELCHFYPSKDGDYGQPDWSQSEAVEKIIRESAEKYQIPIPGTPKKPKA